MRGKVDLNFYHHHAANVCVFAMCECVSVSQHLVRCVLMAMCSMSTVHFNIVHRLFYDDEGSVSPSHLSQLHQWVRASPCFIALNVNFSLTCIHILFYPFSSSSSSSLTVDTRSVPHIDTIAAQNFDIVYSSVLCKNRNSRTHCVLVGGERERGHRLNCRVNLCHSLHLPKESEVTVVTWQSHV